MKPEKFFDEFSTQVSIWKFQEKNGAVERCLVTKLSAILQIAASSNKHQL